MKQTCDVCGAEFDGHIAGIVPCPNCEREIEMAAEQVLQKKIQAMIIRLGGKAIIITCPPCESGTPDIMACIAGVMLVLEVKVGYNKPTTIQQYRLGQWEASGAKAHTVWSLEEAEKIVKDILKAA